MVDEVYCISRDFPASSIFLLATCLCVCVVCSCSYVQKVRVCVCALVSTCDSWRTTWETLRTSEYLMWSIWKLYAFTLCLTSILILLLLLLLIQHALHKLHIQFGDVFRPHTPSPTPSPHHRQNAHKSDGERFNSNENVPPRAHPSHMKYHHHQHQIERCVSPSSSSVVVVILKTVNECARFLFLLGDWYSFRFTTDDIQYGSTHNRFKRIYKARNGNTKQKQCMNTKRSSPCIFVSKAH